jgi:hypothetical protein
MQTPSPFQISAPAKQFTAAPHRLARMKCRDGGAGAGCLGRLRGRSRSSGHSASKAGQEGREGNGSGDPGGADGKAGRGGRPPRGPITGCASDHGSSEILSFLGAGPGGGDIIELPSFFRGSQYLYVTP